LRVTDAARCAGHLPDASLLTTLRRARWWDVLRLLKEVTVELSGFVEHRQQVSLAAVDERLDGILAAGNEALDQRVLVQLVTFRPDVRRLKQSPQAIDRAGELARRVGADDAATARQCDRFDDAGETDLCCQRGRIFRDPNTDE